MERKVGTISRGIRCPIIREGDDLAEITICDYAEIVPYFSSFRGYFVHISNYRILSNLTILFSHRNFLKKMIENLYLLRYNHCILF